MTDKLDQLIAKHASETDVRKRAHSLVKDADGLLDEMAKEYAAKNEVTYLEAYDHVTSVDAIGKSVLKHREESARFVESQPAQD
jgi:hypothetical protein